MRSLRRGIRWKASPIGVLPIETRRMWGKYNERLWEERGGGGKLNHSHSSKLSCTRLACLYIGEGSQKTEKKKGTPSNRFLTAREKKENNFGQQFLTAKERHIWREK